MVPTRYEVAGWGRGELWTAGNLVLAHELELDSRGVASVEGQVLYRGTSPSFRDARPDPPPETAPSIAADLIRRVRSHLAGDEVSFEDVELDLEWCTPFQRSVLDVLRAVPRGEVVSYGELAALAGYPGAGRAVGTVCARNRFSLFVPCHRVVSATGIGSYGSAGPEVKRRLLALEGVML